MPYIAGTRKNGVVESPPTSWDLSDAAKEFSDFVIVEAPLSHPVKDGDSYREMMAEELDAAALVQRRDEALAQTVFTQDKIRKAFKALGMESTLNVMLEMTEDTFSVYWGEADYIDLNDPRTKQALALASITDEQIQELKLVIAGLT